MIKIKLTYAVLALLTFGFTACSQEDFAPQIEVEVPSKGFGGSLRRCATGSNAKFLFTSLRRKVLLLLAGSEAQCQKG